ncbi:unnamed protein product [Brassica oleracea var. botrytis]
MRSRTQRIRRRQLQHLTDRTTAEELMNTKRTRNFWRKKVKQNERETKEHKRRERRLTPAATELPASETMVGVDFI